MSMSFYSPGPDLWSFLQGVRGSTRYRRHDIESHFTADGVYLKDGVFGTVGWEGERVNRFCVRGCAEHGIVAFLGIGSNAAEVYIADSVLEQTGEPMVHLRNRYLFLAWPTLHGCPWLQPFCSRSGISVESYSRSPLLPKLPEARSEASGGKFCRILSRAAAGLPGSGADALAS